MITIIHGDDIVASRKLLIELKSKNKNHVSFEGEKLKIEDLVQEFEGGDLFGNNKTFFIENLLSRKAGKESEDLKDYIRKNSSMSIYLWEGKEIAKAVISSLGQTEVNHFKIPKNIFAFLDSIKPGNGKALIVQFHDNLKTTEPDFIFQMIIRQIRLLLAVSEQSEKNIDEALRLADWQKSKLRKQASLFSKEKLVELHSKLYQIDLGLKTGALSLTLEQAIDMLLLEI